MKSTLVVFFLSVQSSYSGNTEVGATEEAFDTVQFYAANGTSWRIKTYAQDQDVHIWLLGSGVTIQSEGLRPRPGRAGQAGQQHAGEACRNETIHAPDSTRRVSA
jgi:hypothetical protein